MEGLPPELQEGILQQLGSAGDLKAVRLVSRFYDEVAARVLFGRVSVTVRWDSFARLDRICDSELARHVRCLRYNIWEAPFLQEWEWNRASARLGWKRADDHGNHHDDDDEERGLLIDYADYLDYFRRQVLDGEYELFERAFQRLRALGSLEVREHEPAGLSTSTSTSTSTSGGRVGRLGRVIEAALCSRGYVPSERCDAAESLSQISRPLTMLLAHGAVTHGALESLTLQGFRWHWLDMRGVRMWHESGLLHEAVRSLRRFRISVSASEDADIPDPAAALEVWKALFGSAERLEHVHVSVGDVGLEP